MKQIKIFLLIGFVFLSGLGLGCQSGLDTPPLPVPNYEPGDYDTGDGLYSDHGEIEVDLGPVNINSGPDSGSDSGDSQSETVFRFKPEVIITSLPSAFFPGQEVEIGVYVPVDFEGQAPRVGPTDATDPSQISEQSTTRAYSDGSIDFGIDVNSYTTSGRYTFFARDPFSGDELTIELDVTIIE